MIDCRQTICIKLLLLVVFSLLSAPSELYAASGEPDAPQKITAIFPIHGFPIHGHSGSGNEQLLAYSAEENRLILYRLVGGKFVKLAEGKAMSRLGAATRYLSGNMNFLLLAFGRGSADADIPVRLVRVKESLQDPEIVFEVKSERPDINVLEQSGSDVLLNYFESKYFTQTELFSPSTDGKGWPHRTLAKIRMATSLAAADGGFIFGRPYGDTLGQDGDLQFLQSGRAVTLPSYRGVSALANFSQANKAAGILVADGWHQNYAAFGQARLSLLTKRAETGRYALELIENIAGHFRLTKIFPFSAKGKDYVLASSDKAIFLFSPAADWKRETVYEQTAVDVPSVTFAYLGISEGKANIAVLDQELKLVQLPL